MWFSERYTKCWLIIRTWLLPDEQVAYGFVSDLAISSILVYIKSVIHERGQKEFLTAFFTLEPKFVWPPESEYRLTIEASDSAK